jgi:PAS domain S-box-containing protein
MINGQMVKSVTSEPAAEKRGETQRALDKHLRELRCLYNIASISGVPQLTMFERIQEIVRVLPRAFHHPENAFARITLDNEEYKTPNYTENMRKLAVDILVNGVKAGAIEIGYTHALSGSNGVFSKEEKLLMDALAERLGAVVEHRRAEQSIKDEKDKAQRYLDLAGVIFLALDEHANIKMINRKGCAILGCEEKDIIGRNWFENFVPPKVRKEELGIWYKLMSGVLKDNRHCQHHVITGTGEECLIDWHHTVLKDENGKITGSLSSGEDITEPAQYQELLETISNGSPLGIYILQDHEFQYTNPQFQRSTGYADVELIGRDLCDLIAPDDADIVRSNITATFLKNNPTPCEFRIVSKDGQLKWMMQTISNIHYKGRPAILGNLMDISERKHLEMKVIEYEEISKMKSDLLATVSHELRTPLATIKGYSTLILDYYHRLETEETKDYLKSIDASTDRLTKLVSNLLDSSQMEAGLLKIEKTLTDINQLIKSVISEASIRADQYQFVVKTSRQPLELELDARRIHQVLDNLIDNAVKYSPSRTKITISASKMEKDVQVVVTDEGPGIPAGELKNIFERMYRLERRFNTGADGVGLGLYICEKLVQAHGGRIWAESEEGKGSTFNFTLPLSAAVKSSGNLPVTALVK